MTRLLVVIGLLLTACGTVPQSHGGPVQDQVSLIDALRRTVTVDISGTVAQPFLQPDSGTTVRLSNAARAAPADLQLFQYGSAGTGTDAHHIRADGRGTATTIVDWVAPPHFFLRGGCSSFTLGTTGPLSVFSVTSSDRSLLGASRARLPERG